MCVLPTTFPSSDQNNFLFFQPNVPTDILKGVPKGTQQDADDFFCSLLNRVEEDEKRVKCKKGKEMEQIFTGSVRSTC